MTQNQSVTHLYWLNNALNVQNFPISKLTPSMPLARHILVTISESLYTVYIRGNDEVINGTG
ncbi:hypothetical protein FHN90_25505 [Shigella sonnei]|nr:hypothetical protein [Escherichia coli]EFW7478974.1 hypothetical protein [Shigella sonnei]